MIVVQHVMPAAEPPNVEGFAVVVVVHLLAGDTTHLARLTEQLATLQIDLGV
jgi:hypothetical protein